MRDVVVAWTIDGRCSIRYRREEYLVLVERQAQEQPIRSKKS